MWKYRRLQQSKTTKNWIEKDYLIICDVGAYGISLASNYNVRPKPLELLINNSKIKILKKRQKISDLI